MSEVIFRNIEKKDLDQVFVLLNQLKQMDIDTVDKDSAWNDFIKNTSSNSIVGLYNDKIVAYGSVVVENKVRGEVAGHIEDIVVDSEVRGKMIGVSLIKELIKVAENKSSSTDTDQAQVDKLEAQKTKQTSEHYDNCP